ncbi:MAG TPA: hypothetical protein VGP64_10425 [Polyangia bacterium]|jgi:hypothetical protein
MKYVALAALAATYWLLVATAHLLVSGYGALPRQRPAPCMMVCPRVAPVPEMPRFPRQVVNPMRRWAVVSGMNAVKPQIAQCHEAYGLPGLAMVNVVIAPSGLVSSARVTGRFAGTPTGACVEQAVLTARFPPSDGLVTPYPFQLR